MIVDTLNGASGGHPALHKAKQFLSPFLFRASFALKALWERPMPKPVASTEPSSHPLTRFTAQSRRDRRGELRRRSIPAASPRSQPTDTAPRHTDALRELVPDRVESLKWLRDLSGYRDRDLAPPMGEVDVEGALDVGGVLGIHSDTDGVEPWRENCLHPGRHRVAEESQSD